MIPQNQEYNRGENSPESGLGFRVISWTIAGVTATIFTLWLLKRLISKFLLEPGLESSKIDTFIKSIPLGWIARKEKL